MRILLTGSSGFIGQALLLELRARRPELALVALVRSAPQAPLPGVAYLSCPALDDDAAWAALPDEALDVVIHCAGLAHQPSDSPLAQRDAMQAVNVGLTQRLIDLALQRRARRFVLLSSIAVNGQETAPGQCYRASDAPAPLNAYGESKRDAELLLWRCSQGTDMDGTVVRPPMVYGPGAPGNFDKLIRALRRGLPLPLRSATRNRRSFVSIDNLVDLLHTCIDLPAAAGQTFLVSDGEDLSTADLLRRLGRASGRPARLLPMPTALIQTAATLLGRREIAQRLLGDLRINIDHTVHTLDWTPPLSVDEGLRRAAAGLNS
jgi:nucleoside-diphosphate-sugar epimerase